MKETKQIGSVYVDAGLIWIGDPCYFWPEEGKPASLIERVGTWQNFCAKLHKTSYPYRYNFDGLGVAVTSGLGDGIYPVYATIEDHTIISVTIQFIEDEENEMEEEE